MVSYEGEKDYIFISYSHRNEDAVMRIAERLQKDGCRIWYDEGINPGTEWPEIVATHLRDCALFIAFISREYLDSFNCKREIDYAVSKRKPFIYIMLEDVQMTPGMEMQLSGVQGISKYEMDDEHFFAHLYQSELLASSRDTGDAHDTGALPESPEDGSAGKMVDISHDGSAGKAVDINPSVGVEETPGKALDKKKKSGLFSGKTGSSAEGSKGGKNTNRGKGSKGTKGSKRMTAIKIAVIIAAALAAAVVIRIVTIKTTEISIAGTKIEKNEAYLTLSAATLTSEDLKQITMLDQLNTLNFKSCAFPDGAGALQGLSESLRTLDMEGCTGLSDYGFISSLDTVETINIKDCGMNDEALASIGFSSLPQLRNIRLNGNKDIASLDPLASKENLRILEINDTGVSDLAPLSGISTLAILEAENTSISDLTPISSCTELEELNINRCKVATLKPLENMKKLKLLEAYGNELRDLDGMQGKEELESLGLAENKLENLNGLESAFRLENLIAYNNALTSIEGLSSCTVLRNVDLHDNELTDASVLSKSKGALARLDLRGNKLTDLSALSGMPALTKFFADDNELTDISFLEGSSALEILSAENNKISSFEPIKGLTALQNIYLGNNEITGKAELENMPALSKVTLQHNKINEISFSSEERESLLGIPIHISLLAAYDNPLCVLKDVSNGSGEYEKASDKINEGYMSFPSEEDADPYAMAGCFHDLYLADCPYDIRLKLEEKNSRIEYTDAESMDSMVSGKKGELGFSLDLY